MYQASHTADALVAKAYGAAGDDTRAAGTRLAVVHASLGLEGNLVHELGGLTPSQLR